MNTRIERGSEFAKAIQYYLSLGFTMHWVTMSDWSKGNRTKKAKAPIGNTWGKGLGGRPNEQSLMQEYYNADSDMDLGLAVACGSLSGELEVIDLDTKYWPNIDVLYLSEVKAIMPELYPKLRIHSTVSGGKHVLFFNAEHVQQGNDKLAKRKEDKGYGIETRAEGGYVILPPTEGYEVINNASIPILTRAERDGLIMVAKLLDETVKTAPVRVPKSYRDASVYSTNPFDAYGYGEDSEQILLRHGWKLDREGSVFLHFTRPGKTGGTSATFHKEKRFYRFFTTGSEFDDDKNYSAASVSMLLDYGGDGKRMYRDLVEKGYGKYHSQYETVAVKKYAAARKAVPNNFSEEAKARHQELMTKQDLSYPWGVFWKYNPDTEAYSINLMDLIKVMNGIGVRMWNQMPVKVDGNRFWTVEEDDVMEYVTSYIKEEDEEERGKIVDKLMRHWKQYSEFLLSRGSIERLDDADILQSGPGVCYKCFRNGVLEITKSGKVLRPYSDFEDKYVNVADVVIGDYREMSREEYMNTKYVQYLSRAFNTGIEDVQKLTGYYCWPWKGRGFGYLPILQENLPEGQGGGSGKGLYFELLGDPIPKQLRDRKGSRKWTTMYQFNGRLLVKQSHGFTVLMQGWNMERIVHMSEIANNYDLGDDKDHISDGFLHKVLWKNQERIQGLKHPKFGGSMNGGLKKQDDAGVTGRIRYYSLSGYYSRAGKSVFDEFGGMFPDIWDGRDWDGYYNFIADGVKMFMCDGKLLELALGDEVWKMNFDQSYGRGDSGLREWLEERLEAWSGLDRISNKDIWGQYQEWELTGGGKLLGMNSTWLGRAITALAGHSEEYEVRPYRNMSGRGMIVRKVSEEGMTLSSEQGQVEAEFFGSKQGVLGMENVDRNKSGFDFDEDPPF